MNVKIFVLYCTDDTKKDLPVLNHEFYEEIDLRRYWENTGFVHDSDGDFFKSNIKTNAEYIGVVSGRFNHKWGGRQFNLEDLYKISFKKNEVYGIQFFERWYDQSVQAHPGMEKYLDIVVNEDNIDKNATGLYCQNFICHRDVFFDWQRYWKKWFNKFRENKPLDYYHHPKHIDSWNGALMERITTAYFLTRKDLIIKGIE